MKKYLCLVFLPVVVALAAKPVPAESPTAAPSADKPTELSLDRIEHIYLGYDAVTAMHLRTGVPIQGIALGSKVVQVDVQEEAGGYLISLRGEIPGAVTNMNVTFADGTTSVFLLETVEDRRMEFRRVFTAPGLKGSIDLSALAQAPVLKPADINYAGLIASVEQAAKDPVFRGTLANYRVESLGKVYPWNNCMIHLLDAHAFLDMDLIVLRVQWVNTHSKAIRLSARQLGVFVANKQIDVIATKQRSPMLLPGQMESAYIFIQGQKLSPRNAWEIGLPPDAAAVRAMMGGN